MMRKNFKTVVKTYNKIAKTYSKITFNKINQYHLNKFISMLPKKAKVLDAGCGPGRDVQYFKDYGLDVTGIDASGEMIKEAKKNVKGAKFKKMDMAKTKFKDKTFDGIWASGSIIHEEKCDVQKILEELKRILKDKGVLYISVKEGQGSEVKREEVYNNEPRPFFYYTVPEIEETIMQAGFQITYSGFNEDVLKRSETTWIDLYCKKFIS